LNSSPHNGFTLVEIAIVLVVVGLLIGGVLKSQEMITSSKLKRIVSDNAAIAIAMFSYQDRFLQLPGDDSEAHVRFSVYALGDPVTGDGNGIIEGDWNTPSTGDITAALTSETNMFFAHLRAAALISGSPMDDTKPTNAYGGQIGIKDGALGISGHVTIFGSIEGSIAKIIEAKQDDGDPSAGKIQSGISSGSSPIDMNTAITGSGVYNQSDRYSMAFRL
jgi:prepilin-type N-terminal cleavage/methylation domain-containing protein